MGFTLDNLRHDALSKFDSVIDVRSPAEFAEDHVPGAINLPVMSNEERAKIGTIYVQESAFRARKLGAAIVARNSATHIENELTAKDGGWQPLVYCWRGGQRSGSFASILSQIGWRTDLLEGGYRSYRRLVVKTLYEDPLPHRFVLLDGNTGSGKTAILHVLAQQGAQTLDLEGLANHRGSLLGAMRDAQPSQKMFETRLALALSHLDLSRPVVAEAESSKIGERLIPASLWKTMRAASRIDIAATLSARAGFLTRDYADVLEDPARMAERLNKLRTLCGHERVDQWLVFLNDGKHEALAAELMQHHYDRGYDRSRAQREHDVLATLETEGLEPDDISRIASQVAALLDQL
ncbi:tRNA 2-selenouridine(34) synthase MnmH [Planktotalea sp.]|uniref:tRNA 2-selenouridine(34) synthase MnmH n=1 Tax=Planktotalea sp. TaxID=2029877 RepID=UPI0025F4C775|nr:tRNA 2-selenouridine(34) synthase MnmH [Planktotalea sp.]